MTDHPAAPAHTSRSVFQYLQHPRIRERADHSPAQTTDERIGVNGRIGVFVTTVVGTMWAAYLFALLTLVSLPAAIESHNTIIIVGWVAQTFLQLVLLPIIIVGQNVQARAADKRSQQTYSDAEAILHECLQLQEHLQAQDRTLTELLDRSGAPPTTVTDTAVPSGTDDVQATAARVVSDGT